MANTSSGVFHSLPSCTGLKELRALYHKCSANAKYIFDESNDLWYELQGDYYIPCLTLPDVEGKPVSIWGQRHLRYIKQKRKALYSDLLTSGRLNTYLADINRQATEQMLLLTKQIAEREDEQEKRPIYSDNSVTT